MRIGKPDAARPGAARKGGRRAFAVQAMMLLLILAGCVDSGADPAATSAPFAASASPAAMATPIPAPGAPGEIFTVAAEEYLSLREAPDTGAACLRRLEPGERVELLSIEGAFARVRVLGTGETGYVLRDYLTVGSQGEPSAVVAAGSCYEAQVREFLSLRVAPDPAAERIARLPAGTLMTVLEAEEGFARVQVAQTGARGYVMTDYLILSRRTADESPPPTTGRHAVVCREYVSLRADHDPASACVRTLPPGTRVWVAAYVGAFARVTAGGDAGYVLAEYLTPIEDENPPGETFIVICEEYVSLREAPDASSARIAKLGPGTVVRTLDTEGEFAHVTVSGTGQSGYVLRRYLLETEGEPDGGAVSGGTYEVRCDEYLTVRAEPSASSAGLDRLLRGELVRMEEFDGLFARISGPGGISGYVLAGYLAPENGGVLAELSIVQPAAEYSYEAMTDDIAELAAAYPGLVTVESAGASLQGRDIPVLVIGDPGARCHILIQGGIHGREHMTSLLVMAQAEYCLRCGGETYLDGTVSHWLRDVCVHFLPMANPDGVTISQGAVMTGALRAVYESDLALGNTDLPAEEYLELWKANGAGVDLNRNFSAGWDALGGPSAPSSSRYRGAEPADQPETQALVSYTLRYGFDAALSYHASGSCLYWEYGGAGDVNGLSRDLARALATCARYPLAGEDGLDAGGYKDWAMLAGIPSVTLEIGGRPCPLPVDEFATVWARNRNVPAAAARWVSGN